MKNETPTEKNLYELCGISLSFDGVLYFVKIDGRSERAYFNPLEAWSIFEITLDCRVRRRIGDIVMSGKRLLFKLREFSLSFDGEMYVVRIDGEPEERFFFNLLEAWRAFWETLDCRVRRRIGDMLEKQGRNRYTGLIA